MSRPPHTPPGGQTGRTLAAELALGVLDGEARARAEARAASDPDFAAEAAAWSARLHPLSEEAAPVEPPAALWSRIEAALPAEAPGAAPATQTPPAEVVELAPRRLMRRWRTLAIGLGAAVAACVAGLVFLVGRQPDLQPILAARLEPPASSQLLTSGALFTATLDRGRASVVLTPVNPGPSDPRVRELWLIPKGGAPMAAGLIDTERTRPLHLSPELVKAAAAGAVLAVSLEPKGGAPNGVPTGPVIAQGELARI